MYKNLLVPLDGSKLAECIQPHLETIVTGCEAKTVYLIRVIESLKNVMRDYSLDAENVKKIQDKQKTVAEKYLNKFKNELNISSIVEFKLEVLLGNPAEVIADYITHNDIGMVLIATHGRSGPSKWVWGSNADRILRASCAPILMVRAPGCVIDL